jgi:hypothetical protein
MKQGLHPSGHFVAESMFTRQLTSVPAPLGPDLDTSRSTLSVVRSIWTSSEPANKQRSCDIGSRSNSWRERGSPEPDGAPAGVTLPAGFPVVSGAAVRVDGDASKHVTTKLRSPPLGNDRPSVKVATAIPPHPVSGETRSADPVKLSRCKKDAEGHRYYTIPAT